MKKIVIVTTALAVAALMFGGCDNRNAISRSKPQVSFGVDMTVVKDLSLRKDITRIEFRRNTELFSDGIITIGSDTITSSGDGVYYAQTPFLRLIAGGNSISFASPDDSYRKTVSISLPDSFKITTVDPPFDYEAVDVTVAWSNPNRATGVILSVFSKYYQVNDTDPLVLQLPAGTTSYVVPDTIFMNHSGAKVTGTYYIYLAAYNGSFGTYPGMAFPIPQNMPLGQALGDPSGHLRYGTVAPCDSIRIL